MLHFGLYIKDDYKALIDLDTGEILACTNRSINFILNLFKDHYTIKLI